MNTKLIRNEQRIETKGARTDVELVLGRGWFFNSVRVSFRAGLSVVRYTYRVSSRLLRGILP